MLSIKQSNSMVGSNSIEVKFEDTPYAWRKFTIRGSNFIRWGHYRVLLLKEVLRIKAFRGSGFLKVWLMMSIDLHHNQYVPTHSF